MYKEDLALNNILGLICHKTQPTQKSVNLYCSENQGGLPILILKNVLFDLSI